MGIYQQHAEAVVALESAQVAALSEVTKAHKDASISWVRARVNEKTQAELEYVQKLYVECVKEQEKESQEIKETSKASLAAAEKYAGRI